MTNLTAKDLRRAADLLEKIDAAKAELAAILSGTPVKGKPGRKPGGEKPGPKAKTTTTTTTAPKPTTATAAKPKAKKTGIKRSAAVRAKMAESQKKRWAAKKKTDKAAAKAAAKAAT